METSRHKENSVNLTLPSEKGTLLHAPERQNTQCTPRVVVIVIVCVSVAVAVACVAVIGALAMYTNAQDRNSRRLAGNLRSEPDEFMIQPASAAGTSAGTLPVTYVNINIPTLVAGGHTAQLIYPSNGACGTAGCPFLSFAHGTNFGPASYSRLLATVASAGYIIVAVDSCPRGTCPGSGSSHGLYTDQLNAIEACKSGSVTDTNGGSVAAILNGASFEKVGLLGHSMGGGATVCASSFASRFNIAAAVALHPSGDGYCPYPQSSVQVPIFFVGGSLDVLTPTSSVVYPHYVEVGSSEKAFINVLGAHHEEPMNANYGGGKPYLEDPWTAKWFDCFLKGDQNACSQFSENNPDGICGAHASPPIVAAPCGRLPAPCSPGKTECFSTL